MLQVDAPRVGPSAGGWGLSLVRCPHLSRHVDQKARRTVAALKHCNLPGAVRDQWRPHELLKRNWKTCLPCNWGISQVLGSRHSLLGTTSDHRQRVGGAESAYGTLVIPISNGRYGVAVAPDLRTISVGL
jgi:hypothetical protein